MKIRVLFLALLVTITIYSQTQVGDDIDGEASDDWSGWRVSLSSNGSVIAIGAPLNGDGHVRVYQNNSDVWTQIGNDIDNQDPGVSFPYGLSLSSDGTILAIGAPSTDPFTYDSGHVSVYQNNSGVWSQIGADIVGEASDNFGGDNSGYSVSLSSDGNIVAIGAPYNDGNGNRSGHVRVYKNMSGIWSQIGTDIDGEEASDQSGYSVSLSSDGSVIAIGAPSNDGVNGSDSGHVRVYENMSGIWSQIGTDIDGEEASDQSGYSVSLSSDGNIVAIGAPYNDGVNGSNSGHVRVYQNLSGVWTQKGADIDGEITDDRSGWSVSLSSNGNILAIGSYTNDGNGIDSGHVRVYKYTSDSWSQIGTDIDGESADDRSGWSVSLSSDGNLVAIGAYYNGGNGYHSGHARVYELSGLLSLEDNEISKNFAVFPNPVNNNLQVQLATTLDYIKATIYNYFGQLVVQSETTSINVSSLSSGVYFLEVETNKGKGVKKFIKE